MTRSVYFPKSMAQAQPVKVSPDRMLEAFDSAETFDAEVAVTILLAEEGADPIVRVQGSGALPREIEVFRADETAAPSWVEGENELSRWCAKRKPLVIRVSGDALMAGAIRVVHLFDSASVARTDVLRIEMTADSRASLIEEFAAPLGATENAGTAKPEAPIFVARTELSLAARAKLQYAVSVDLERGTDFSWVHVARAAKDAQLECASAFSGHAQNHVAWFSDCAEEGADIRFLGAARAEAGQKIDFTNDTFHSASHTQSQTRYQTVLSEKAQTTFGGMIRIPKTSLACEAVQKNQNLLLSPTAIAKTFPQLEIETDEVRCSHGATVSPVSEEQIYYMQARGISRKEAETMIVSGTIEPVVARFPTEAARNRVREVLT